MANCYLCGTKISGSQVVRMNMHVGTSVGGFNLSLNVLFNLLLNGVLQRRLPSVRSYYSKRNVCATCAATVQENEARKIAWLIKGALIVLFVLLIIAIAHK